MLHSDIRDMAFRGESAALRAYGDKFRHDEFRRPNLDALEMVALLSENDYVGAEAKSEELLYKYRDTAALALIEQVSDLVRAIVDFALGNFTSFHARAERILTLEFGETQVEQNDKLALYKLMAETYYLFNDRESLEKIYEKAQEALQVGDRTQAHYLLSSIKALYEHSRGEFLSAIKTAELNVTIAKQNNYQNVASAVGSKFIIGRCLISMGKSDSAHQVLNEVRKEALESNKFPWYFAADGFISRDFARNHQMTEALAAIRLERELISSFTFENQLTIFPDSHELYVRYLLRDIERIETLISRLPELNIVKYVKEDMLVWNGKTSETRILSLPDETPGERLYREIALAEFHKERESIALGHARKALEIAEKTGAVEIILSQDKLFGLFMKATLRKPTTFMEDIARAIPEEIKKKEKNGKGDLVESLTNRELEVVQHLATGKPISAIAGTLHVSMNTMKTHLRNTYRKLGADGRDTAVAKAKELFLI